MVISNWDCIEAKNLSDSISATFLQHFLTFFFFLLQSFVSNQ